jgi:glycosyltransferase involved in cell wall biosynthesis
LKVSVIIITKNEEHSIRECLESISWADEIIIVDSGSKDKTLKICKEFGAKIFIKPWYGFGFQKNEALKHAKFKWILSIDADEIITNKLKNEIIAIVKSNSPAEAYSIPRRSFYCGKLIRFSGWQSDFVVRFFQKKFCKFSNDLVHEKVLVSGTTLKIKSYMIHNAFENFEEVIKKINIYSSLSASMLYKKNTTSSLKKALFHAFWSFIKTYIIKLGFLDGRSGLMLSISNAEGTYYRYIKLMMLNSKFND